VGSAMTSTWTKQEVEHYDDHKLLWQLRQHTQYRNSHELFTALLLAHGKPPHPPEVRHTYSTQNLVSARPEFIEWRQQVAMTINESLHCSIDPSLVMRKYFLWLQENWNKSLFAP
jgi:hypothetical protein